MTVDVTCQLHKLIIKFRPRVDPPFQLSPSGERKEIGEKNKSAPVFARRRFIFLADFFLFARRNKLEKGNCCLNFVKKSQNCEKTKFNL